MIEKLLMFFVAGMLSIITAGCEKLDTVESIYPNYQDVLDADAIGHGKWIPVYLPQSARNIKELHNPDTNEIWLSFVYDTEDLQPVADVCNKINQAEIRYPRKPSVSWWPITLTENQPNGAKPAFVNYIYYQCVDGGFLFQDSKTNEVYYWHKGS